MSDYFRALAWGIHSPVNTSDDAGCVLWFRARINDRLAVLGELPFHQTTEARLAGLIRAKDLELRIPHGILSYTVASPMIFTPQASEKHLGIRGEYVSERLAKSGIDCVQGDLDSLNGWSRIHALMDPAGDGRPRLTIDENCVHLIKALESGMSDDSNPDELSQEAPALTALRLAVMSRPSADKDAEAYAEPPFGSPAYYMRKLRQGESRLFGRVS